MYLPNDLQSICSRYGLIPSKRYGQNFLINQEPIEKMIEVADLSENDVVVEIGPGFGVLTFELIKRVKKVFAFEIEKKLKPYWDEMRNNKLEIVWGNVLGMSNDKCQMSNLAFRQAGQILNSDIKYKIVANLPYQITSAVIRMFLEAENKPETMVLMVQKEVAERICAKPGEMSVLSVATQYYATAEIIMNVPRSYFWPEPAVDSAVIKLKVCEVHKVCKVHKVCEVCKVDEERFFRIVKAGFANRRKFLIKNLEVIVGKKNRGELEKIFNKLNFASSVRAQELSVEDWKKLAEQLSTLLIVGKS
jgi:16S rRNA (adenine1518-N6/adenine1519-N6)-dimethyltransferase